MKSKGNTPIQKETTRILKKFSNKETMDFVATLVARLLARYAPNNQQDTRDFFDELIEKIFQKAMEQNNTVLN